MRPQIGLALGAGSARGLAHIGVLQVLEREGIPVDAIAGTSMGAVIGALYATGNNLAILEKMACEIRWDDLVRLTITRLGLVSSERIYGILRVMTKDQDFSDLPLKLAVVATDINSGEEVVIADGPIADGVRASISIPGIFVPVNLKNRMLVDGALVNRIPVETVRSLGVDVVIGVDVGYPDSRGKVGSLPDVIMRTIEILERQLIKLRPLAADVLISPPLGDVGSTQLNRAEEIIGRGRRAAEEALPDIKRKLREKGLDLS